MENQPSSREQFYPQNKFIEFRREEIEQSIGTRFEAQVAQYPQRLAVRAGEIQFTYQTLNQAVNRLAHALFKRRGEAAEPIALLLEQGVAPVIAIMGVVKAGKFYVPLDPSYPLARIQYMLADSTAQVIVTHNRHLALAQTLASERLRIINVDALEPDLPIENPRGALSPDTLAYLMYTSGSTGQPKGVMENHRNLLHHILRLTNSLRICRDDRQTLLRSCSFNGSVRDIFGSLLNGASLHPLNLEREGLGTLAGWLTREGITTYRSVVSTFRNFAGHLDGRTSFPHLRLIHVGGEPVTKRDVSLFQANFSQGCILVNGLGITETGSVRHFYIGKRSKIESSFVPVGYPIQDMNVMLLDEGGQEVKTGHAGEIAVKSCYLSPGYWRKPDLTRARFLPDPKGGAERTYLTGDLGRMSEDGCLIHLGRKDFQVKVRGHRIEIAEIEAALLTLETVKEAIVVAHPDDAEGQRLVAYCVPSQQPGPTVSALRQTLAEHLPQYMIPHAFILLENLPILPSGKINRQALPLPETGRPQLANSFIAPRTLIEEVVATLWSQLLKIDSVGVDDNFMELGGDSLLATQIVSRLRDMFGIDLSLPMFFMNLTVTKLAQLVEELRSNQNRPGDIS